ncbi:GDSL esterase/lipase [Capsicum galapagoense]
MTKSSEKETFHLSGPQYLTKILDWRNASHRRSIAASLVKGVYILERDRQKNRQGPDALAPPWWESFHFSLIETLVDSKDQSIFGAIYQYKCPNNDHHSTTSSHHNKNPPKYVIAFRGTLLKPKSAYQDLKLDLRVIVHRLHNSTRITIGLQAVQNIVDLNQGSYNDIWLAGHSLGSTISLIIGRDMVKNNINLETYLFNPPFASLPIEKIINNSTLKLGIRCAHSVVTAGLSFAINMVMSPGSTNQPNDTFPKLCGWVPYLFVNKSDPICSDYFGYFEYLEKMIESGADEIARVVTRNSLQSILETAIGRESEPSQNLPSAHMITNLSPCTSHGLSQWWAPGLQCNYKRYKFW